MSVISQLPYWAESICATLSALSVAPMVCIVDKAIFSNASGKATLSQSFVESFKEVAFKPHVFFSSKSFLWIWAVYSVTYIAANNTEQYFARREQDTIFPKFVSSSIANIGMSLAKDRAFTRMYGVVAPKPLPITSAICYGTRDMITIGASFTAVAPIAKYFSKKYDIGERTAYNLSQLSVPCIAQLFNTPIFLVGMDIYNNPNNTSSERAGVVKKLYVGTFLSRCARIFPAFGIGGVLNKELRKKSSVALTGESEKH